MRYIRLISTKMYQRPILRRLVISSILRFPFIEVPRDLRNVLAFFELGGQALPLDRGITAAMPCLHFLSSLAVRQTRRMVGHHLIDDCCYATKLWCAEIGLASFPFSTSMAASTPPDL